METQVVEDTKETKAQLQSRIKNGEMEIDKMHQLIYWLNKELESEQKQHRDLETLHQELLADIQKWVSNSISNIYHEIHDITCGFYFEILLTFMIGFQRLRDKKTIMETSEAQNEHEKVKRVWQYNFFLLSKEPSSP